MSTFSAFGSRKGREVSFKGLFTPGTGAGTHLRGRFEGRGAPFQAYFLAQDKLEVETLANRGKEQLLERARTAMEGERRKVEDLETEAGWA